MRLRFSGQTSQALLGMAAVLLAFPAIGFNMADQLPLECDGECVDIAFTPTFNTFRGETTVQLHLRDIHISPKG